MPLVSQNPATGRLIKRHREHTAKDVSAALAAVHSGFLGWRELSLSDRARHLNALAATLRGLGLGKIRRTRTLEDTPSVRGMINAVKHLVEIVEE